MDLPLTRLARAGFTDLATARDAVAAAAGRWGTPVDALLDALAETADPDRALERAEALAARAPDDVLPLLADAGARERLLAVLGASEGLAAFALRHPDQLDVLARDRNAPLEAGEATREIVDAARRALADRSPGARGRDSAAEDAFSAVRVAYRRRLLELAAWDLTLAEPASGISEVGAALADLAAAALDAGLVVAREEAAGTGAGRFPAHEVAATRLAIVGMGKAGARELNYVSDVDVLFVADSDDEALATPRALEIATRLAQLTMRAMDALALEPALWQVDANLRPEGRDGALVRTIDSYRAYYERWAAGWEFQALIKARPLAGDRTLGAAFVDVVDPLVWSRSAEVDFVGAVQAMRERVTASVPPDEVERHVKLGPGGLRDVEFTVQLLELVHGREDVDVRRRSTLSGLAALTRGGYVGRAEAAELGADYRLLRLLEHRIQLTRLRRTHLMPTDEAELRALARASRLAPTAEGLLERWSATKRRVRGLHERLFYRPLLRAVAESDLSLTDRAAAERLAALGFADPRGALAHIAALTTGVSRRAAIQRTLTPVVLEWLATGADPDQGLTAFRRISDELGSSPWFLRLLRDSSVAAERLCRVLSGSRFASELLVRDPGSVSWLGDDGELVPRGEELLADEVDAILARHPEPDRAASALRALRRRETLRLALSSVLGFCTVRELGEGLTAVVESLISGVVRALHSAGEDDGIRFAVIAMGRFGGREMGLGSDADVLWVHEDAREDPEAAASTARRMVERVAALVADPRLPLELDAELRPEGRSGTLVRSLRAYRAYYERWSVTWEAQALVRARGVAGDPGLVAAFTELADPIRRPMTLSDDQVREIRRTKARVESDRLPRGADPSRHLKLGRGSLSDVEWLVQLIQLQHAHAVPGLATTSTLGALDAARAAGLISADDADRLAEAWTLASRIRSALVLVTSRASDVLPSDRTTLESVARILELPRGAATELETRYLKVTRRARAVFERLFSAEVAGQRG